MKKAVIYGVLASFFFAFTFVFNRSMNLTGGSWMWSASLRYLLMLPMLLILTWRRGALRPVLVEIRRSPGGWLLWSTVGFGLFYAPLSFASVFGQSWLVASCWQITIVAGVLLTPLWGQKIPLKSLLFSGVILAGVFLLQYEQVLGADLRQAVYGMVPVLVAAFSYPLGNRKMMQRCAGKLDTLQRVFGMTLCSLPFWLLLSAFALLRVGPPSGGQLLQSLVVALFSGVVATLLFFKATNLVRGNPHQLAAVEATQSGEVIFTLAGGILLLGDSVPSLTGWLGISFIVAGMALNSLLSGER